MVLLACLFLSGSVSAGVGIQAYVGDVVPLSGYSPTSNFVYLFLTGPNLPVNGVALNDITRRADEGGFTVVPVQGEDDSWSYKWSTAHINGRLDEGTYTIWVVNGPNDRSNLRDAEYGTISVTLGRPSISATIWAKNAAAQTIPGSLVIISVPDDASAVVNGEYRGKTPLTLENLEPGTYSVSLSKFGYAPSTATAVIRSGERGEISAVLTAERGTLIINTTPAGADISIDGNTAGISPVTLENILPGNHTILMVKKEYIPAEQQVSVAAGNVYPVTVTLLPVSPLPALPLRTPGLTAGTLLALCMAAAGVVLLRQRYR